MNSSVGTSVATPDRRPGSMALLAVGALLCCSLLLTGCGQKGPLVAAPAAPASTASAAGAR